jgi:hypothetical protein
MLAGKPLPQGGLPELNSRAEAFHPHARHPRLESCTHNVIVDSLVIRAIERARDFYHDMQPR